MSILLWNGKSNYWKPLPRISYLLTKWLFILTAGRGFVPHNNRVMIIYTQQHMFLKPNHCLSLNLSESIANEPSFWLTAPHKLITVHTQHYRTVQLNYPLFCKYQQNHSILASILSCICICLTNMRSKAYFWILIKSISSPMLAQDGRLRSVAGTVWGPAWIPATVNRWAGRMICI